MAGITKQTVRLRPAAGLPGSGETNLSRGIAKTAGTGATMMAPAFDHECFVCWYGGRTVPT